MQHDSGSARRPINEQPFLADGRADGTLEAILSQAMASLALMTGGC
jgi:hypothetical protein